MDGRTISSDPLSLTLASLSWSSWQCGATSLPLPFGLDVPAGQLSFYAIRSGRCWVSSSALTEPVELQAGDFVLFPNGSDHRLTNDLAVASVPYDEWLNPHQRPAATSINGSSHTVRIVYGHLANTSTNTTALSTPLSNFLRLSLADHSSLADAAPILELIEREQLQSSPGWQAIANQLVQVLFHQALRAFVAQGQQGDERLSGRTASSTGLTAVDPAIGLVIGLLHAQPEKPWTVASLARWVNMSRSAFSERFRDVVGKPPLHYLTELRMNRACELLRVSDLGVKQVAATVGYESPSSFTNAFKRWFGVSPASYRGGSDLDDVQDARSLSPSFAQ